MRTGSAESVGSSPEKAVQAPVSHPGAWLVTELQGDRRPPTCPLAGPLAALQSIKRESHPRPLLPCRSPGKREENQEGLRYNLGRNCCL